MNGISWLSVMDRNYIHATTFSVDFRCQIESKSFYVNHSCCASYSLKDRYSKSNLLTPWCRVLLEKLTGLQLVKKFPAFHGTRRFITALTTVRHLSLYWASPIQSIYPHPTSWRSVLILSTHLRLGLPSGLLPSGFPTKTLYTPSPHPYAPHAQPISFFSILSPAQCWVRRVDHLALVMQSPPFPRYLIPPRSKYSPQHHVLKHQQLSFLPQCQRPSFTPIQNNRQNYTSMYLDL